MYRNIQYYLVLVTGRKSKSKFPKKMRLNGRKGHRISTGFFIVSEPTVTSIQDIGVKVASVALKHCNIYKLYTVILNQINNHDKAFIFYLLL